MARSHTGTCCCSPGRKASDTRRMAPACRGAGPTPLPRCVAHCQPTPCWITRLSGQFSPLCARTAPGGQRRSWGRRSRRSVSGRTSPCLLGAPPCCCSRAAAGCPPVVHRAGAFKHPGGQISGSGRGGAVLCRVWPAGRGLSIWPRGPDLTQHLAPGPDASIWPPRRDLTQDLAGGARC